MDQVLKIDTSCTKMESNIVSHLLELVDAADRNRDGKIDIEEWKIMGTCLLPTSETSVSQ